MRGRDPNWPDKTAAAPALIGGPYAAPHVRRGDWLDDEVDGRLEVGGWTDAPVPWPRRKKTGRPSLILTGDLVRALRVESVEAICHWWGVRPTKVWMWRQALGIGRVTDGTRKLLQERTGVPEEAAARGRIAARQPEALAKMAESKRGKPVPPQTRAALLRAAKRRRPALGSPYTDAEIALLRAEVPRRALTDVADQLGRPIYSVAYKVRQLGLRSPSKRLWTAEEDALLRELRADNFRASEVATLLQRSVTAIAYRYHHLGLSMRPSARGRVPEHINRWTAAHDHVVRARYGRVATTDLARELGRTPAAVRARARLLGVTRNDASLPC